jgi:hypothetical protein
MTAKAPEEPKARAKETKKGGGGRATAAGMGYEYRYAASLAASLLASEPPPNSWGLGAGVGLTNVLIEQDTAVDDIVCETSLGGFVFIQAKRSLTVSAKVGSPLVKAIYDAVDLLLDFEQQLTRLGHPPRSMDFEKDLIVIGVGKGAPVIAGLTELNRRARSAESWNKAPGTVALGRFLAAARTAMKSRWKDRCAATTTLTARRQLSWPLRSG